MNKGRLEAFSDGVLAVIITIMVLEMKSPNGTSLAALRPVIPVLLTYVLSFVYIGIYWNNHHHLLHATQRVNGATLWANLHLLFWLSLVPFATAWMGENRFDSWPVAVYGIVLLLAAIAYFILTRALISLHGESSTLGTLMDQENQDPGYSALHGCTPLGRTTKPLSARRARASFLVITPASVRNSASRSHRLWIVN